MTATLIPNKSSDKSWTRLRSGLLISAQAITSQQDIAAAAAAAPANAAPAPAPKTHLLSLPESPGDWQNPNDAITYPLSGSETGQFLAVNMTRTLLIIINNSMATSPDVAPTLWVAFGRSAQPFYSVGLTPGEGLVLDKDCPRAALWLTWAGEVNTGHTVVVGGCVIEGTHVGPQQNAGGGGGDFFQQWNKGIAAALKIGGNADNEES